MADPPSSSPPPGSSADSDLRVTAARWTVRRDRGLSPAETEEFERWLSADPRHARAVDRSASAWGLLDGLAVAQPIALHARPGPRWRAIALTGLAAAAAVAAAFIIHREPARPATAWVRADHPQTMRLADGTLVRLNAGAELSIRYTPAERRIDLARGEAYFEVAKNAARPFVIRTAKVELRDVGTAFDVKCQPTALDVWVTEGEVRVSAGLSENSASGSETALVLAGQRAQVALAPAPSSRAIAISSTSAGERRLALAWEEPLLQLSGATLATLASEFELATGQRLVLADPELAELHLGGRFRADDLDGFVRLLEDNYGIVAEHRGGEIVLRLKK